LHIPAIVKVLVSLGLILLLNRVFRRLAPAVTGGVVLLAFTCGFGPTAAVDVAWDRFRSLNNLSLLAVVLQVVWLSSQMKAAGVMQDLVDTVRGMTPGRAAFAVLPAVIGLLPMPGGALFSAPLVDRCDRDGRLPPILKTRINYWFRHVWEYWWPLYPGVLLAVEISRLEVWQFMLLQLPLTVVAVAAGWWFLLRAVPPVPAESDSTSRRAHAGEFLRLIAPILAVIVCYSLVRVVFPGLTRANRYAPMVLGLVAAAGVLQVQRPLSPKVWGAILATRKTWQMALLVALVRVYGAFIEARLPDGMTLVGNVRSELDAWGIPVILMVMVIPFVTGITTGLAIGFVGGSFPIVLSLAAAPGGHAPFATVVLAYACGYMGMMLSPVHICLIVTNEHFATRLGGSLTGLVRPAVVLIGAAVTYSMVLKLVG